MVGDHIAKGWSGKRDLHRVSDRGAGDLCGQRGAADAVGVGKEVIR